MKSELQRTWLRRGLSACLLWPAALVYGGLIALRRHLYRLGCLKTGGVAVPVVVVGNVVAGGAGKTPLVMALIEHLRASGYTPGVVSRGYGRHGSDCLQVQPDTPANDCGDEPLLIRRSTGVPVVVAPRRLQAARALLQAHPDTDVIVCDDGLQHYALRRDINIAVFDDRGVGNGWLLPAGPLREPWPGLAQGAAHSRSPKVRGVDLVLHSGSSPAFEGHKATRRLADHAMAADGTRVALQTLRGKPLHALAGIARPAQFFAMLEARGLTLSRAQAWPDHHPFSADAPPFDSRHTTLCTEKDAVKLFALFPDAGLHLLAVPLQLTPEPGFFKAFDALLSQLPSPHGHKTP